jgi:CheY-like chemotaxis protein
MRSICLIAEDTQPITYLLQTYVEMCGMQAVIAAEGERVLDVARQNKIAVILLNHKLPGKMRGWDVLKALKADALLCTIPVITYQMDEGKQVYQDDEADASLQMPLLYESFRETLEHIGLAISQPTKKRSANPERSP